MRQLSTLPQAVASGSTTTLLNGAFASLSGPVGFTPTQPRIKVKQIVVVGGASSIGFAVYKASSSGATGPILLQGNVGINVSQVFDLETELEAGDFLTAGCPGGGSGFINVSAEIGF